MRYRNRAFSLAEVIVSLFILSLLAGFALLNMRKLNQAGDTHALALNIADRFRAARESAISSQQPVAVILPSNNDSLPVSQNLYIASGLSMASVTKVFNLAHEHQGTLLFQGTWPLATGSFSFTPPVTAKRDASFDVNQWLKNPHQAPYQLEKDYALVFTPDGGVISNDLPLLDNAYHLVAAAGATYSSGITSPSGRSFSSATSLGSPWTITITPSGQVTTQVGIPDQGSSLILAPNIPILNGASPPALSHLPALSPKIQKVQVTPNQTASLPSGINITLTAGQRVSLCVNATETTTALSGRDMFVKWTCTPASSNSSPASGIFSVKERERMHWDTNNQLWTASWDWMAPLTAKVDDKFTFNCELGGDGLTGQVMADAKQEVLAIPSDKIYLMQSMLYKGVGGQHLFRLNLDGSNPVEVMSHVGNPASASSDGSQLMINGYNLSNTNYYIVMGNDGAVTVPPTYVAGLLNSGIISPLGNKVACWTQSGLDTNTSLRVLDLGTVIRPTPIWIDGPIAPKFYSDIATYGGGAAQAIVWSPNQQRLLVTITPSTGARELRLIKIDDHSNLPVTVGGGPLLTPAVRWSADGQSFYAMVLPSANSTRVNLYKYDLDLNTGIASNGVILVNNISYDLDCPACFDVASDGTIIFCTDGDLYSMLPGQPPKKIYKTGIPSQQLWSVCVAKN